MPSVVKLNKKNTQKKRTVFVFSREENYLLKGLAHYLHLYDGLFSPNLYSFRKNIGVKRAIADLNAVDDLKNHYVYKVDIHDYFNSVDQEEMLSILNDVLKKDEQSFTFIENLLTQPLALSGDKRIEVKKGIMAGVPISGFLANLYLKELDEWFYGKRVIYARYSDDIIVFAKSQEDIEVYKNKINQVLCQKNLTVNPNKQSLTCPNQKWDFLGFCFDGGEVDVSPVAIKKLKDKMRRKARALVRWKDRTGADKSRAISAFILHFNKKLFNNYNEHEVTWCRWYFPTITTSKSLHVLDEYALSCIRYISSGKHNKANYNLRYEDIKGYGFKSLVWAYHKYKKTNELL